VVSQHQAGDVGLVVGDVVLNSQFSDLAHVVVTLFLTARTILTSLTCSTVACNPRLSRLSMFPTVARTVSTNKLLLLNELDVAQGLASQFNGLVETVLATVGNIDNLRQWSLVLLKS
jgi:hypothetical protein